MVWAAWATLVGAAHYCCIDAGAVGPCCAPSGQTLSVCAQIRCQEILGHCWTSLSPLQPVPMESSLWQAGHQEQVTQISQAVAGLLSRGTWVPVLCSAHGLDSAQCFVSTYVHAKNGASWDNDVCMGGLVCPEDTDTSPMMAWVGFWCSWCDSVMQPGQMLRAAVRYYTLCHFTV